MISSGTMIASVPEPINHGSRKDAENKNERQSVASSIASFEDESGLDVVGKEDRSMPKRPLSAYILFSQEARRKIKLENPHFLSKQISKMSQRSWRQMSNQEKERY